MNRFLLGLGLGAAGSGITYAITHAQPWWWAAGAAVAAVIWFWPVIRKIKDIDIDAGDFGIGD